MRFCGLALDHFGPKLLQKEEVAPKLVATCEDASIRAGVRLRGEIHRHHS